MSSTRWDVGPTSGRGALGPITAVRDTPGPGARLSIVHRGVIPGRRTGPPFLPPASQLAFARSLADPVLLFACSKLCHFQVQGGAWPSGAAAQGRQRAGSRQAETSPAARPSSSWARPA